MPFLVSKVSGKEAFDFQNMQRGVSKYAKRGGEFQNMQNLCQYLQNLSREEFRMWRIGSFYLTLQSNLLHVQ